MAHSHVGPQPCRSPWTGNGRCLPPASTAFLLSVTLPLGCPHVSRPPIRPHTRIAASLTSSPVIVFPNSIGTDPEAQERRAHQGGQRPPPQGCGECSLLIMCARLGAGAGAGAHTHARTPGAAQGAAGQDCTSVAGPGPCAMHWGLGAHTQPFMRPSKGRLHTVMRYGFAPTALGEGGRGGGHTPPHAPHAVWSHTCGPGTSLLAHTPPLTPHLFPAPPPPPVLPLAFGSVHLLHALTPPPMRLYLPTTSLLSDHECKPPLTRHSRSRCARGVTHSHSHAHAHTPTGDAAGAQEPARGGEGGPGARRDAGDPAGLEGGGPLGGWWWRLVRYNP